MRVALRPAWGIVGASPWSEAQREKSMSENPTGLPGPTEQHEALLEKVGEWNVRCKYFMNPAEPPIEADGTDRVEAIGPFWTKGQFHCDVMGNVITGLATTGFDPKKGKYVSTWQDSSNPFFYYFEGTINDDDELVMEGDNIDPMSGNLVKYRSVEKLGKDTRKLELFIEYSEDSVIKILEYDYTRA
jgi:Protein of unknown function (DUF1579)